MKSVVKKLSLIAISTMLGVTFSNAATELDKVMKDRGLTQADILAAAKTYTPSGGRDKYLVFSSGGQSGQIMVYGVPSMRILKYIGVFTPEPWQGWGFDDESKEILAQGRIRGRDINWGDTHHPAISETKGVYDGRWLAINDKANPRIAIIDLEDMVTKQIVVNPVFKSDHGGAFFTPNSDYILEACQYAAPFDNNYHPIEEYKETYRGGVTLWKFNHEEGKIEPKNSFTLELPPYMQDLSDAGKEASDGWGFTNSFNSEMYTGGIEKGLPPFEAGMSRNDTDFLHVYNWKKLAELAKDPKNVKIINDSKVIPMEVAIKNDALFLIPEPKSPHGVDVSPDGKYIVVCGKLDTHATVYSWEKIQKLIKAKDFVGKDPYGIPILDLKKTAHCQAELGLGPLHNQYGPKWKTDGEIYTSLYVDSQVVRWNYLECKVVDRQNVNYNIGHLCGMEGKTEEPQGEYIIALNKLAIDRFNEIGPLHPQNHQLIDISGKKMQLLYDMPVPLGEPHQAVAMRADKIKHHVRYKMGTNAFTGKQHVGKTLAGQEKIVRKGNHVYVYATVVRSHINPEHVTVNKGDTVTFYLTNLERAEDETHGFTVDTYGVHGSFEPGKTASVTFVADRSGVFPYYCTEFCSALHLEMEGILFVKPHGYVDKAQKDAVITKEEMVGYKKNYEDKLVVIDQTQDIINGVVTWLKENNYADYPYVAALVTDAFDQLGQAKSSKEKHEKYAKEGKYKQAFLWAEQYWQYQVKTADVGLRAKKLLAEKINK